MSREGDLMRRALTRVLLPELERIGFQGKPAQMLRRSVNHLDVLSIQYWKYGGEFLLEFARCPRGDLQSPFGTVVPEEQITLGHMPIPDRARLEQRGSRMGAEFRGFSFARFGEDTARYEALAEDVVLLLPQIEAWLETRVAGSHIAPFAQATGA